MSELVSAPIKRRKRIRHQTTLVQRLLTRAEEARAIASRLMGGPEREALLQRAEAGRGRGRRSIAEARRSCRGRGLAHISVPAARPALIAAGVLGFAFGGFLTAPSSSAAMASLPEPRPGERYRDI